MCSSINGHYFLVTACDRLNISSLELVYDPNFDPIYSKITMGGTVNVTCLSPYTQDPNKPFVFTCEFGNWTTEIVDQTASCAGR